MSEPTRKHLVERRIWRLGYLLTGDAAGAAGLVDRVVRTRPDVVEMDPAKLDRLIIQHARELRRGGVRPAEGATPSKAVAEAMAVVLSMPEQPREAWVLTHVDMLDELHLSRAMDCSKTAARNHLQAAEKQMTVRMEERLLGAARGIRAFADSLDPGTIIESHRAERRAKAKKKWTVIGVVAGLVVLMGAWVVLKFVV